MSKTSKQLVKALIATADKSARSLQIEVGPSELGSCSRQMFYKLSGQKITNFNTLKMASIFGTAIHTYLQGVIESQDTERFLTEIEVEWEGMKGHIDIYDQEGYEVIDWKTTTKKNQGYFPTKSQIWQVQVYAYLLEMNGKQVNTVTLVSIPRDGNENDILYHSEPFNIEIAKEALAWLENIEKMEEAPAPEKDGVFCSGYCPFYDATNQVGCAGRSSNDKELEVITDEMVISAAQDYLTLQKQIKELEARQESARAVLEGNTGQTPDGTKIIWSETAGRKTLDTDHIAYFFEKHGESLIYKQSKPSLRLSVKK